MKTSRDSCICIIICINYSDYLASVIDNNLKLFNNTLIVTKAEDTKTLELINRIKESQCAGYAGCAGCEIFITDKVNQNNAIFNKSAMVRQAQKHVYKIYPHHWICLLDADIKVPLEFGHISFSTLDKHALYGIVRHIYINSYDK